eukprot:768714-Hanusia_phi.AAC.2
MAPHGQYSDSQLPSWHWCVICCAAWMEPTTTTVGSQSQIWNLLPRQDSTPPFLVLQSIGNRGRARGHQGTRASSRPVKLLQTASKTKYSRQTSRIPAAVELRELAEAANLSACLLASAAAAASCGTLPSPPSRATQAAAAQHAMRALARPNLRLLSPLPWRKTVPGATACDNNQKHPIDLNFVEPMQRKRWTDMTRFIRLT